MIESGKKSGLAVLVGRSNVGKSTLLNSLVGTKVAITSPKPQTTRHLIQGVVHDPRGQIVFVDTPGVFTRVPDRLTRVLNDKAREALQGIDVIIYVVDPNRHVGKEEEIVHRLVRAARAPKILVLNKSDLKRPYLDEYLAWQKEFDEVIEVSALEQKNLRRLVDAVIERLPEGEPFYPGTQLTDAENRFWLSELIREKIFLAMHDEIPYSASVEVTEAAERENGTLYIRAAVLTTATRYKKMLIGAGAKTIRKIGSSARKELEAVTGKKVYLDLEVEVDERWQERFV